MHHLINGEIEHEGMKWNYDDGVGYIEKDWGTSFPNHRCHRSVQERRVHEIDTDGGKRSSRQQVQFGLGGSPRGMQGKAAPWTTSTRSRPTRMGEKRERRRLTKRTEDNAIRKTGYPAGQKIAAAARSVLQVCMLPAHGFRGPLSRPTRRSKNRFLMAVPSSQHH